MQEIELPVAHQTIYSLVLTTPHTLLNHSTMEWEGDTNPWINQKIILSLDQTTHHHSAQSSIGYSTAPKYQWAPKLNQSVPLWMSSVENRLATQTYNRIQWKDCECPRLLLLPQIQMKLQSLLCMLVKPKHLVNEWGSIEICRHLYFYRRTGETQANYNEKIFSLWLFHSPHPLCSYA